MTYKNSLSSRPVAHKQQQRAARSTRLAGHGRVEGGKRRREVVVLLTSHLVVRRDGLPTGGWKDAAACLLSHLREDSGKEEGGGELQPRRTVIVLGCPAELPTSSTTTTGVTAAPVQGDPHRKAGAGLWVKAVARTTSVGDDALETMKALSDPMRARLSGLTPREPTTKRSVLMSGEAFTKSTSCREGTQLTQQREGERQARAQTWLRTASQGV